LDAPPFTRDAAALLVKANGAAAAAGYWYGKTQKAGHCRSDNYYSRCEQAMGIVPLTMFRVTGTGCKSVTHAPFSC